jgi:hypothetical protein
MDKTTKDAWSRKKKDLSPEALETRKKINKKILKFGCLPIFILSVFIAIVAKCGSNNNAKNENATITAENVSNFINGLAPVDVYLNMEKQSFKTEKQLGGEYGNLWISTISYEGMDCRVETFSSNINNVESVRATAMIDIASKEIIAAKQFIQFVATLPYENAKPEDAVNWIDKNFDNDKASIIIGDAKFTIQAPSVAVRVLLIEKAK